MFVLMYTDIDHSCCPCNYNVSLCGIDLSNLDYVGEYREYNLQAFCLPCLRRIELPCALCGD